MIFRVGDIVRYQLGGSGDLVGRLVKKMVGYPGVRVERGGIVYTVPVKDIVRVEVPVLTDCEGEALAALAKGSWTLRGLAEAGVAVAPKTMSGLARRGLVLGMTVGVARVTTAVWGLTDDGRRVVRDRGY